MINLIIMSTSMVRVSDKSQKILKELKKESGYSYTSILDKAVEELRRKRILENTNNAFSALRNNKEAWQEELRERETLEGTLMDNVE